MSAAAKVVLPTLVAALLISPAPSAHADSELADARTAATVLRAEVDLLAAKSEAAAEDFGAAQDALDEVVSGLLSAEESLGVATRRAAELDSHRDNAARQLYMSGGVGALYGSILEGRSISDVLARVAAVESVAQGDLIAAVDARRAVEVESTRRRHFAALTEKRRLLEDQMLASASLARELATEASSALDGANALVRRLVEQERAAAEAAAESAARELLGPLPWVIGPVPADSVTALDRAIADARTAPATRFALTALTEARRWLGTPYSAGGGGQGGPSTGWCSSSAPDDGRAEDGTCAAAITSGFDCSSLMVRVFGVAGLNLPRTSRQQWLTGVHVALTDLRPGDLLFWAYERDDPGSIHHVALYLGRGLIAQAPHTGGRVEVAPVALRDLVGAVRPG